MWRGVVFRERFDVELRAERDVDAAVCWHCRRVVSGRVVVRCESEWGRCDGAICWLTFTPATGRRCRQAYGSKFAGDELDLLHRSSEMTR